MTEPVGAAVEIAEIAPTVLLVRFNRPAERNPLSTTIVNELSNTLPKWFDRDHVEAVIFTGNDDVFASGANIRELASLDGDAARRFAEMGQRLLQSIARARQKTIAAINGYCLGGGLDLALSCKFRIASRNASFAHPGARLGIITGWGGTQLLPRLIGKSRALELFASAKTINAETAFRIGLVDRIADPVVENALQLVTYLT